MRKLTAKQLLKEVQQLKKLASKQEQLINIRETLSALETLKHYMRGQTGREKDNLLGHLEGYKTFLQAETERLSDAGTPQQWLDLVRDKVTTLARSYSRGRNRRELQVVSDFEIIEMNRMPYVQFEYTITTSSGTLYNLGRDRDNFYNTFLEDMEDWSRAFDVERRGGLGWDIDNETKGILKVKVPTNYRL